MFTPEPVIRSLGGLLPRATGNGWEQRVNLAARPFAYPFLRGLARCGPVVRVPPLGVVVNDTSLAREVLSDSRAFGEAGADLDPWTPVFGPSVLRNMQGAAHRSLRRHLSGLFAPAHAERLCARTLAEPIASLTDRLGNGAAVDLVDAMWSTITAVVNEVIGVNAKPEANGQQPYRECQELVLTTHPRLGKLSPAQVARAHGAFQPIGDAASGAYHHGDESTVMGRMRALGLSEDEARGLAGSIFVAGVLSVVARVPRLIALLHDTRQIDRVADDLSLLDATIDEALRLTSPLALARSATAATRLGRVAVRPGDRIIVAVNNCCRAYGPFDLGRVHPPELRRLWFGAGSHMCIGYALAMAQIRAVTRAVLAAGPLRIVQRRVAHGAVVPAYRQLTIARAGKQDRR